MGAFRDLTGQRFGRLVALSHTMKLNGKTTSAFWTCKCDCGNYKEVRSTHLVQGSIQSCGCLHADINRKHRTTHDMTGTRFYRAWRNMRSRVKSNRHYTERGITVCDRWTKFQNFQSDMYESYLAHVAEFGEMDTSLDRTNNDGPYSPDNCRWATRCQQSLNTRRNKRYLIRGEVLTLTEIARKYKIPTETVFYRVKQRMDARRVTQRRLIAYERKSRTVR